MNYHPFMSINNRSHPRFEVKPGKWVKVWKKTPGSQMMQLIDLSTGGMSFVCLSASEFKRGDHFLVIDFKDRSLNYKIVAVVRYVRVNFILDETYTDYKVGVEFLKIAS